MILQWLSRDSLQGIVSVSGYSLKYKAPSAKGENTVLGRLLQRCSMSLTNYGMNFSGKMPSLLGPSAWVASVLPSAWVCQAKKQSKLTSCGTGFCFLLISASDLFVSTLSRTQAEIILSCPESDWNKQQL